MLSAGSWSSFVFLETIIAEEVDSVGGRGSGDATMVDVPKLLETFFEYVLRSSCFVD